MNELVIKLSLDGNKWCALVGSNLQEGIAGFGDSPNDAIRDLAFQAESDQLDLLSYS